MDENKSAKDNSRSGTTGKNDANAGSAGFNQGAEQEKDMNEGVADGTPHPEKVSKEKENPKSGKVG